MVAVCCLLLGMLSSTALAVITSVGIQIESWQDAENQDGIRPDQVDMILLRDGKEYTRVPLSDMALWMTLCAASLGALAMLCMKKRRTE